MPEYSVFGGRLASEVALPELLEAPPVVTASIDWRVRVEEAGACSGVEVSHEELESGVHVRLLERAGVRSLVFDDTGRFDVCSGGREISWSPASGADIALARTDLLGRVFALVLHQSDRLVLHGSAVSIGGRAVGFLAEKGTGKSTIALAMVRAGARLITDDTLAVCSRTGSVLPGVQAVRLWSDAADALSDAGRPVQSAHGKLEFRDLGAGQREQQTVPLDTLYLLRRTGAGAPVPERVPLQGPLAAVGLMPHAKLGRLVRGALATETLARCAELTRAVPVQVLNVPSGFERLPGVAAALLRWHQP